MFSEIDLAKVVIHIHDYAWQLCEVRISKVVNMQMLFLPGHIIYQMELNISNETEFSYFPNT
jgi:hypothetical protein